MATANEIKLAEEIMKGDSDAVKEIVLKFIDKITAVIRLRLGRENPEWQDVVQEVLLAVMQSLQEGQFDPTKGTSLQSYIYGITLNKIRDYYKSNIKEKRITNIFRDELLKVEQESQVEKEEIRKILRRNIANLKEKYQEVLYLRFYEELSITEISQQIGLPPRRVSERLFYALKLLHQELGKQNMLSIFLFAMLIYCVGLHKWNVI